MSNTSLQKQLINIGFSDAEARVYLELLPHGSMAIQEVVNATELPRSTVVDALENLVEYGVATTYMVGKRRNFNVPNTDLLEAYIDKKERAIALQKATIENMIPTLSQKHYLNQAADLNIQTFEGEDGLKELYELTLKKKVKEILRMSVRGEKFSYIPDYLRDYKERKNKKGIRTRLLIPESPLSAAITQDDPNDLRETRILPDTIFNPDASIAIWGDYISFTTWDKRLLTVVIENSEIQKMMTEIFELCWSLSNKDNGK